MSTLSETYDEKFARLYWEAIAIYNTKTSKRNADMQALFQPMMQPTGLYANLFGSQPLSTELSKQPEIAQIESLLQSLHKRGYFFRASIFDYKTCKQSNHWDFEYKGPLLFKSRHVDFFIFENKLFQSPEDVRMHTEREYYRTICGNDPDNIERMDDIMIARCPHCQNFGKVEDGVSDINKSTYMNTFKTSRCHSCLYVAANANDNFWKIRIDNYRVYHMDYDFLIANLVIPAHSAMETPK